MKKKKHNRKRILEVIRFNESVKQQAELALESKGVLDNILNKIFPFGRAKLESVTFAAMRSFQVGINSQIRGIRR